MDCVGRGHRSLGVGCFVDCNLLDVLPGNLALEKNMRIELGEHVAELLALLFVLTAICVLCLGGCSIVNETLSDILWTKP